MLLHFNYAYLRSQEGDCIMTIARIVLSIGGDV